MGAQLLFFFSFQLLMGNLYYGLTLLILAFMLGALIGIVFLHPSNAGKHPGQHGHTDLFPRFAGQNDLLLENVF